MTKQKVKEKPFWESGLNPITMQPSVRYPKEEKSGRVRTELKTYNVILDDAFHFLDKESKRIVKTSGELEDHTQL